MLQLADITPELARVEMDILNSDAYFNRVSVGRDKLTEEDVAEDIRQGRELGAERFLVTEDGEYVGVLDFVMLNPNDGYPWLGLLQVDKKVQRQGYGRRMLELYIDLMKQRGVKSFRIGVIENNEPALRFWTKCGFDYVKTVSNNRYKKAIRIYEKSIK